MNRNTLPASDAETRPDPAREAGPLRPAVFAALALIVVTALLGLSMLDGEPTGESLAPAANPHPAWLWLGGLVAGMLMAGIAACWWRAERRANRNAGALADLAQVNAGLRQMVEARETQLAAHRQINGWVYWEQDAHGIYRVIDTGTDPSLARFRQLLGVTRETGIRVDEPARWHRTASLIERRQPFGELFSRRALADGSEIEVEECGGPRYDANGRFTGYAGLIRERRDMPASVSQFDLGALAAIPLPVVILEARINQWRLAWANAATSTLTGLNALELGSIDPQRWIVPDRTADGAARPSLAESLDAEQGCRLPAAILNRFGESTPAQLVIEPQPGPGGRPLRLALIDTISPECARLRMLAAGSEEARREQAARALELEVTARELESFSHTVSHDLRAPLRVVDGFGRILLEDFAKDMPEDARGHLERILAAAGRMNEMIDALLAMARISSQRVAPEPVDLSAIAHSVFDELRQLDPERRVRFEIVGRMQCRGDRILLRIVLENLLGNAWKYTSRRDEARIVFDSELVEGVTVYRVSDNGTGFDMSMAGDLFQIFRRLHSASEFEGTGIGLATVQRIIRRHGGRIWAESEHGAGARFSFTLWDRPALELDTRPPSIPAETGRPAIGRAG